jgi:Uma2 family endonuclease
MAVQSVFTLEQLARMPEDELRHEIDEGELIEMTRPKRRHGRLQARIARLLGAHVENRQLGEVLTESGFVLQRNPDTLRGPDVAFVRAERLAGLAEDEWIEGAPDLVVEIVSPSDTARQMGRKVQQYLAAGTRAVWIVYPDIQSVWVFESSGQGRLVEGDTVLSSPNAPPGFEIPVREIFE